MVCEEHWGKYTKIKEELTGSPLLAETLGTPVKMSLFLPRLAESKPGELRIKALIDVIFIDSTKVKGSAFEGIHNHTQIK